MSENSMLEELEGKQQRSLEEMQEWQERINATPDDAKQEEVEFLQAAFDKSKAENVRWAEAAERQRVIVNARAKVKPQDDDENKPTGETRVQITKEPLVYQRHGQFSFFRDLIYANTDDVARNRLHRHAQEMRVELRDLTSTAGAGGEFIPPLWLQNQWVELLRAARPTADVVTKFPLPAGTNSINLPRLATGGSTAIQASENAAVTEVDPTTNSVTANVRTIAGQVDMSRQLFEFSQPGLDEVLFRDLARDYATKLDIQVLSGSGAAGQALGLRNVAGIGSVTYTDASPTAGEAFPKVADAIQRITSGFLNPTHVIMHPRRWAFFLAAVDSTGRPLFNAIAGQNAMGAGSNSQANGIVGQMQGLGVVLDPNLPTNLGAGTNEDVILVIDANQIYLWEEGAPRTRVFEDIGSGTLTVRLSVWGYFAFMANRYAAGISTITGTGLIAPTF